MAYRDDTDPLKAEETVLARELSALRRRENEVTRALDATRAKLRNERTLPLLEDVRIASPCSASWEDMTGDARVRFCGKCAKNVYNLSEMTRDEAESLLAKSEGEMCVRLYKRRDGTVITTDCPVGVKKKRVRRLVAVAAAAFGAGGAFAAAVTQPQHAMGAAVPVSRPVATQQDANEVTSRPPRFPPLGQGENGTAGSSVPKGARAIGGAIPPPQRREVPHAFMGAPVPEPKSAP